MSAATNQPSILTLRLGQSDQAGQVCPSKSNKFVGTKAGITRQNDAVIPTLCLRVSDSMPLTDTKIRKLKPSKTQTRHADGEGLSLLLKPNGSKLWRFRYRFNSKQKDMAFGKYPAVSLGYAREMRAEAKVLLARGIDPSAAKATDQANQKAISENTFDRIASEMMDKLRAEGMSHATLRKKAWFLDMANSDFGSTPIARTACAMVSPWLRRTSTSRSFAMISSGLALLPMIQLQFGADPLSNYGPVFLRQTNIRLGFWVFILLMPWACWESLTALARHLLPRNLDARTIMTLLMPVFAVFGSLFATGSSAIVFGLGNLSFLQAWAASLASWMLFSFLIVLPLALIADALSRQEQRKGGENLLGFFATKIPEKLRGGALVALQSEGHYVRVYTTAGDDLILMSMEDAMTALNAYPGIRTHRSWWMAVDQIAAKTRQDSSFTSILTNTGLDVPVSRRRRKLVRDQVGHIC